MKRKIISTLFALVLACSLSLVTAAPMAAADPTVMQGICLEEGMFSGGTADGTAEWTAAVGGITPPAGNYMAKLTYGATDDAAATAAKVKYSGTLTALSTLAGADEQGMEFNYYYVDTGKNPYAAIYLDTDSTPGVDMVLLSKRLDPSVEDTWNVSHPPLNEPGGGWHIYGYAAGVLDGSARTIKGTSYDSNDWNTLAGWAALSGGSPATTFGDDADVVYVGYMLGGNGGTNHIAYVDDITIGGVTYGMEPMVLTAEYYKTGASVGVAVFNSNASGTTPAIFAKSDTVGEGGKITIALSETGTGTGVFTGGFQLVNTTPGPGQLLVNEGDSIEVEYTGDWGAGSQPLEWANPPSATVDDTAPVITIVSPADEDIITDATPDIKATYIDDVSGIDTTSVVMMVDGVNKTSVATVTDTSANWTSSANLTDGSYDVTVDVSDLAGNAAVTASWSFTVDTVAPVITDQVATPSVVPPDVSANITFTATVADDTSGVATVKINLSPVDGTADLAMLDDGVTPDETADDGIYTASENITESDELDYDLTVTATDEATNEATAVITLGIWSDTEDPVITSPAITYEYGSSVPPGDTVTISANVTDNIGVDTVTAACTALVGTPISLTNGVGDIWTGTATVDSATGWGDYTVTITAKDAVGNDDIDESLTLAVRSGATGYELALVEGWNLISLPLIPDSSDITVVISATTLASANVSNIDGIRAYDPATGDFPYYVPDTGSGELATMEDGVGYWVFMNEADTLTITGAQWPAPPAVPPSYDVVVGWNLIGFKSMVNDAELDYLANIVGTYPVVWSYDATAGAYVNVKGGTMEHGHGFWLWVTAAGTIVPPE